MQLEVNCKIQCRETWTEGPPQIPQVQVNIINNQLDTTIAIY